MADTLGEDRLLDEVEAALKLWPETTFEELRALERHAPDWLARLCARVRHLEAQVEHEHANATAILRKYEGALADADRAESASQRLTEERDRLLNALYTVEAMEVELDLKAGNNPFHNPTISVVRKAINSRK